MSERNYGSVIVKNDEIIATGYTGAPRRRKLPGYEILHQGQDEYTQGPDVRTLQVCAQRSKRHYFSFRQEMLGATLYLVGKR